MTNITGTGSKYNKDSLCLFYTEISYQTKHGNAQQY